MGSAARRSVCRPPTLGTGPGRAGGTSRTLPHKGPGFAGRPDEGGPSRPAPTRSGGGDRVQPGLPVGDTDAGDVVVPVTDVDGQCVVVVEPPCGVGEPVRAVGAVHEVAPH